MGSLRWLTTYEVVINLSQRVTIMNQIRPIEGYALLLDDQPQEVTSGGVVVITRGAVNMDYLVVRVEGDVGFGQGDRVVLSDPNIGRKVNVDGANCRLVHIDDIIGVLETKL